ncbi:DUF4291 family protein [Streptomyces sp. CoH27]|uniref:DUF4291 family protein n=1 Tax=Streptomyces sp. CoH27 TaxID=2875763 RepID=UPI0035A930F4
MPGYSVVRTRRTGEPVPVHDQSDDGSQGTEPTFRVRARYTDSTVTVHQAYRPEIGGSAARTGRFPPSWKRDRMTGVMKPRSQTPSV